MDDITPLERARRERAAAGDLIDLVSSDFRAFGCVLSETCYQRVWTAWRADPAYRPSGRGSRAARAAIARRFADGDPERVILTAGTSISYLLLFRLLAAAGGAVALPRPSYPLFEELASTVGLATVEYTLTSASGWIPDPKLLVESLPQNATALVVISPNNPCGVAWPRETVASLVRHAHARGIIVIVDGVFDAFRAEEERDAEIGTAGRLAQDLAAPLTIRLDGLSKGYLSPEIKGGWIILDGGTPGERDVLADALDTTHDALLTVSGYAEAAMEVIPGDPDAERDRTECAARVARAREAMRSAWSALAGAEVTGGSAGIHAIVTIETESAHAIFGTDDDEEIAIQLVRRAGLHVHPGYLYGIGGETTGGRPACVVTALQSDDQWSEVARRLSAIRTM